MDGKNDHVEERLKGLPVLPTLVEPGAYAADFGNSGGIADALEPCAEFRRQVLTRLANPERVAPEATAEAILELVDTIDPQLRLGLGASISARARDTMQNACRRRGKRGRTCRIRRWVSRRK